MLQRSCGPGSNYDLAGSQARHNILRLMPVRHAACFSSRFLTVVQTSVAVVLLVLGPCKEGPQYAPQTLIKLSGLGLAQPEAGMLFLWFWIWWWSQSSSVQWCSVVLPKSLPIFKELLLPKKSSNFPSNMEIKNKEKWVKKPQDYQARPSFDDRCRRFK